MKKIITFTVLVFLLHSCDKKESNNEEEQNFNCNNFITLRTQGDVDSFALQECTSVLSLIIGNYWESNNNINDLSDLNNLTNVGSLFIFNNNNLTNLKGLENITYIDGYVDIRGNENLEDITNLNAIEQINGQLSIYANDNLLNLDGLNNLTYILEGLSIFNNNNLYNLEGLENLRTIYGDLIITGNPSLLNLEGLNFLNSIEEVSPFSENSLDIGSLLIFDNLSLIDFCDITNLIERNDPSSDFEGGIEGIYQVFENGYNPTQQDILKNCSI